MNGRKRKKLPAGAPQAQKQTAALQEEIVTLRAIMRQVENLADEGASLGELLKILDTLGKTSTRLASLLRAQRELCEEEEFGALFHQALAEALKELGTGETGAAE